MLVKMNIGALVETSERLLADLKETYTRKKHPRSKPPRSTDTIAWRWETESECVQVFRSPVDGHEWITAEQRHLLIGSLIDAEAVFRSRRGYHPIFHPKVGDRGWFRPRGESYRRQFEFDGSSWIRVHRGESL